MDTPMSDAPFESACECGRLCISLSGAPDWVNACACRNCQKRSNGPLTLGLFFRRDRILAIRGEDRVFRRPTDAGNQAERHFCPRCGSSVFWYTSLLPRRVGVSWGGSERTGSLRPDVLVWCRSLPGWLEVAGEFPRYPTQPALGRSAADHEPPRSPTAGS